MKKVIAFILCLLLVGSPALAAPTHYNTTNGSWEEDQSVTISHDNGTGSDRYFTACGFIWDETETWTINSGFPKIDGVTMSLLGSADVYGTDHRVFLYGLNAPSGTKNFTVETTGIGGQMWTISTWEGVNQTTPTEDVATNQNAGSADTSVSVTDTAAGQLVIDCAGISDANSNTFSAGANQTQRGAITIATFATLRTSEEAGGTPPITMSWTWGGDPVPAEYWGIIGISLREPAAAPAALKPQAIVVQ